VECSGKVDQRRHVLPAGEQVEAVLIAASWCHGITVPGFHEAIVSLQRNLPKEAARDGLSFSFVGVALDWKPEDGYRFLSRYDPFDEIVVGGNWGNTDAVRFIWRDYPGNPSVPQLVVLRRLVIQDSTTMKFGADRLVGRFLGAQEIIQWAAERVHF
jgi:hypothetical protein